MVDEFLTYLSFEKRYSKHTVVSYQNDLSNFSDYLITTYELAQPEQANYPMLRSWIVMLVDQDMMPKSINRKIACLRSYYHFLLKKEYIAKDPTLKIRALKVKKSLPVFVSEDDMGKLMDQLLFDNSFEGIRDKMVFEILYGTGIRLSEIIGLKHSDINLYLKSIKVLGKGNKERIIPINDALYHLTKEYIIQKKNEQFGNISEFFIVTNDGKQTYPMFIYRLVRKYLDEITTVDKRSPHVLRHTFATHLLNKGADLNAIKDLLGHTSLAATQVYTHNSIDKLKAIFDQAHPKS
ncbi:MAG: tyrosine-type recombinase/integrase [Cytophagales bacterium]|nr:tyrosine-type recombinase/integrase [Cytophaga sp.]